ncbi:MAG: hypothetical protein IJU41_04075 [Clostridia bacterium]|nr:hypothetical protein [Clostridia bacterium]
MKHFCTSLATDVSRETLSYHKMRYILEKRTLHFVTTEKMQINLCRVRCPTVKAKKSLCGFSSYYYIRTFAGRKLFFAREENLRPTVVLRLDRCAIFPFCFARLTAQKESRAATAPGTNAIYNKEENRSKIHRFYGGCPVDFFIFGDKKRPSVFTGGSRRPPSPKS